jgi:hypothetical protein
MRHRQEEGDDVQGARGSFPRDRSQPGLSAAGLTVGYGLFRSVILATAVAVAAAGCSVGVPDPSAPTAAPNTPEPAAPTITPGYDAAAVAANDMPFTSGDTLAADAPLGISDDLGDAPGWTRGKQNVAGENQYTKMDGCVVAARVRTNQWPLAVAGDDKASTVQLFQYLDASILPEYLKIETLRWGGESAGESGRGQEGKPAPKADVLVLEGRHQAGAKATAVMARLFSKTGSSIYVSIACPDPNTLAGAKADVGQRLALVPPSD